MALFKINDIVQHKSTVNSKSFNRHTMLVVGVGNMVCEDGEGVIYLVSYLTVENHTTRSYVMESEIELCNDITY